MLHVTSLISNESDHREQLTELIMSSGFGHSVARSKRLVRASVDSEFVIALTDRDAMRSLLRDAHPEVTPCTKT